MDKKQMKVVGIVCLIVCAVCLFVALERNSSNAKAVQAMNDLQQSSPLRDMYGRELKPAMPVATKYALVFAAISGIGGAALLLQSRKSTA